MTPDQVAINHKAITNLAGRLESWGLTDAHQRAEFIAVNLLLDGYRRIEKPPELSGRGSTEAGRERAKELFARVRNGEHLEDTA